MKRTKRSFLFFGIIAILLSNISLTVAQEQKKVIELEPISITATKTEKSVTLAPASVSVIKKEDLLRENYVNLNEVLESIPGVYSYEGKGIATPWPVVNLRGFHGHMRTLIMVNGQPISPSLYSLALVHWTAIPVDVVDRIEVVRGPFSAVYGGDAVGGVVNIITKCPDKLEVTAKTGYGDNQTYKVHLSGANRLNDNLNIFFAFDKKKTNNYVTDYYVAKPAKPPADPSTATAVTGARKVRQYESTAYAYEVGHKGESHWDENTFTLNLGWDISDASDLKLNLLFSEYEVEPCKSASYLRDKNGKEVRSGLVSFEENGAPVYLNLTSASYLNFNGAKGTGIYSTEYAYKFTPDLDLKLSLGLTDYNYEKVIYPSSTATENGGPGSFSESPSKIWQGEVQTNYRVLKNILLTGGINYRYDKGDFKKYAAENWRYLDSITTMTETICPESKRYGLYLQGDVNLFDKVDLYLASRYDQWSSEATRKTAKEKTHLKADDQDAFSPKLAVVYQALQDTTLKLSAGKAFRVPNFFELYQPLTMADTTYLPNPDLDPEITWSWELGVEQRIFSDHTIMNLTYFENYSTDYIDSRTWKDPNNVKFAQRDNFGKTETRGVEFELCQKLTDYLKGFLNYTYIDAEITENKEYPKIVGKSPRYVPDQMFNAGLDFRLSPFSASLNTRYVSRIYGTNEHTTKNWNVYGAMDKVNFVTDVKLGVDFLKNYNASVSVNNIFDEEYYQYSKAPGRTVFGMLATKF